MPRRDPSTGKFVSGGDLDWSDTTVVTGSLASTIPAADLAGGQTQAEVMGENSQIVNLNNELDHDETFEVVWAYLSISLALPTTATAESYAALEWTLRTDLGRNFIAGNPGWGGSATKTAGIVDIEVHEGERYNDASIVAGGRLRAENSHSDSVNGLAAGADSDREDVKLPFFTEMGGGPSLDQDDEMSVPHQFTVDNASDHSVQASFDLAMRGIVHEH